MARCVASSCRGERDPFDWFCEQHAGEYPPRTCGFGGAKDDPAPCPETTREGHWLCDRHSQIVGRHKRSAGQRNIVRPAAPVTVRFEPAPAEPAPRPKPAGPKVYGTCACEGCEAPLFRWNRRYCAAHQRAGRLASQRRWRERKRDERQAAA
jgi:hypothetical protein